VQYLALSGLSAFFLLLCCASASQAGSAPQCNSVPAQTSVSETAEKAALLWKRAVDQDNASELWRLLSAVDVELTNDKGKTALMAALKIGDQCLLEELLQRGLQVNARGYTGGTALMYAVLGNQAEMITFVLSHPKASGMQLNAQSTNGWTAAMIAAAKGFDAAMAQLVAAGADVDIPDVYQWTPLMRAIDNQHTAVVNYLLSLQMLDLDRVNENGSTSLHIAAQMGDLMTVKRLLALGADINIVDKKSYSAKDMAEQNGFAQIAALIK